MWAGLRTGEQIALQWKNVDIEQARIYVRASVVKGRLTENLKTKGSMRTVDLEPQAFEILKRIDKPRTNEGFSLLTREQTKGGLMMVCQGNVFGLPP